MNKIEYSFHSIGPDGRPAYPPFSGFFTTEEEAVAWLDVARGRGLFRPLFLVRCESAVVGRAYFHPLDDRSEHVG